MLKAFQKALDLEKSINQKLIDLHKVSDEENDPQFSDYLEGEYLKEQVESISKISKHVSILSRFGNDQHAVWNFVENM